MTSSATFEASAPALAPVQPYGRCAGGPARNLRVLADSCDWLVRVTRQVAPFRPGVSVSHFAFAQLDGRTRELMLVELELDRSRQRGFAGRRLNVEGVATYATALTFALREGDPDALAGVLEPVPGALWIEGTIATNGRRSTTPRTAARTLADGEFNRYYMRAICQRAIAEGDGTVVVVRAKHVDNPRLDHLVRVAEHDRLDAVEVLEDLRLHPGEATALGMPRGPNSGLSLIFDRLRHNEHDPAVEEPVA